MNVWAGRNAVRSPLGFGPVACSPGITRPRSRTRPSTRRARPRCVPSPALTGRRREGLARSGRHEARSAPSATLIGDLHPDVAAMTLDADPELAAWLTGPAVDGGLILHSTPIPGYIAEMVGSVTLSRIGEAAQDQWGLITRRQAELAGVPQTTMERLTAPGSVLDRVAHGVYRMGGAPEPDHLALRAAWLQLEPGVWAWERTPAQGVVSHRSAAALYGLGAPACRPARFHRPSPEADPAARCPPPSAFTRGWGVGVPERPAGDAAGADRFRPARRSRGSRRSRPYRGGRHPGEPRLPRCFRGQSRCSGIAVRPAPR